MSGQGRLGRTALVLAVVVGVASAGRPARAEQDVGGGAIRIGMINSLFRDLPEPMVQASMGPFRVLMESMTGLRGDLVRSGDAYSLGRQLNADKVQLAVFHGFEFAWAQKKYPGLRPLMIAVNQQRLLYAHLVVGEGCKARDLAGLKGKTLAVPQRTREHCLLFLDRACQKEGKGLKDFFAKVLTPANAEDALDDLVDGKVQAALVDGVALNCYKRRKPGRHARLQDLLKSAPFPAAVVAYHAGAVDEDTLRRFERGMLNANRSAFGRQLLTLWKITGFERIPRDYEDTLKAIAKVYPPPQEKVVKD